MAIIVHSDKSELTVLKGFDYIKAFVNLSIARIILIESFKVIHCSIIKVPTLVRRLFRCVSNLLSISLSQFIVNNFFIFD